MCSRPHIQQNRALDASDTMSPRLVNRLQLRFGAPRHGWLIGMLVADGDVVEFDGSDTPADWITELVWALDALACGHERAVVTISAETAEYRLLLAVENGLLHTQLVCRGPGGTSAAMLDVLVAKGKALVGFWRGLRELESRMVVGAPEWRYRFPSSELVRLREKLVALHP